jgi:hypothetical protein
MILGFGCWAREKSEGSSELALLADPLVSMSERAPTAALLVETTATYKLQLLHHKRDRRFQLT